MQSLRLSHLLACKARSSHAFAATAEPSPASTSFDRKAACADSAGRDGRTGTTAKAADSACGLAAAVAGTSGERAAQSHASN